MRSIEIEHITNFTQSGNDRQGRSEEDIGAEFVPVMVGNGKHGLAAGPAEGQGWPPVGALIADSMWAAGDCPCPEVRRNALIHVITIQGVAFEPVGLQDSHIQVVDAAIAIEVTRDRHVIGQ